MNASKPETISSSQVDPVKSIEEEIRNSARGDLTNRFTKSAPGEGAREMSETIGELVQKLGATSIAEIEKLISDLQAARSYLKAEGDRIQQEMTRYAHLSDTASASVKIITESLGQWRNGNDTTRGEVAGGTREDAA
jgi:methyl-accepting chemotaxis protein